MTALDDRRFDLPVGNPPLPPRRATGRLRSWQELAVAPRAPVHAAICERLFRRATRPMALRIRLPDGSWIGAGRAGSPVMTIHSDDFFHRVGVAGLIGFGESYMVGDWHADELAAVLRPFAARMQVLIPSWMQHLRNLYVAHQPWHEHNTKRGARTNISRHYDLSNDLFARFLDETMTYSCALFEPGDSLARAQLRKIDRVLDLARVGPDTRVLEIGTGWGALAVRAAARGAFVHSITLSEEQQHLARRRVAAAGCSDRVRIDLCDYRDVDGEHDAIVSVEMIEAVGEEYWPDYFRTIDAHLAPGGRAVLQAIVLEHERMIATRGQYTWIHKYVFPGGALPSVAALEEVARRDTTLRLREELRIGSHYATTLRHWRESFDAHGDAVDAMGFDATFRRMWDFYLAYCEAGFAERYLDDVQLVFGRDGDGDG